MLIDFSDKMERDAKKLKDSIAKARLNKTIKTMSESQDGSINNMFGDHQLTGGLRAYGELHLNGDRLLVYKFYVIKGQRRIFLEGIYSHKELNNLKGADSLVLFSSLNTEALNETQD